MKQVFAEKRGRFFLHRKLKVVFSSFFFFIIFAAFECTMYAQEWNPSKEFGFDFSCGYYETDNQYPPLFQNQVGNGAAADEWTSYPLFGGELTSICIHPQNPDIVYVGTRDAGVFKTIDGGQTWHPARSGLSFFPIRSLQVSPQNPDIIYAGTDFDGIWKSTDGGSSWFRSDAGLNTELVVFRIAIDPENDNTLYAGLGGGVGLTIGNIYKSEDAGGSWQIKDTGIPRSGNGTYMNAVISLIMDPSNSSIMYVGTNFDGAYQSTNAAETWVAINDSLPYLTNTEWHETVNALATDSHHSNRLSAIIGNDYYILHEDAAWEKRNQIPMIIGIDVAHLYFHPSIPDLIYACGDMGGLYKSIDGGSGWNTFKAGISEIAFHSSSPDTIYGRHKITFSSAGGMFKTTDQGDSWTEMSEGITANAIQSVALDPKTSGTIYSGTGQGHFFRTENGGISWERGYYQNSPNQISYSFGKISDIAVDPIIPQNVYIASFSGFYKSTDYGKEFTEIDSVDAPGCIAIDQQTSNAIYVGSGGSGRGIYKSEDQGLTWSHKNEGLPLFGSSLVPVLSLEIDPNDSLKIWAGTQYGGGIVHSTNGAESWQVMGLTDENMVLAIAINPDDDKNILAGTADFSGGKIFKSVDGGLNWMPKITDIASVQDIIFDPRDSELVYAATEGYGILRSFDGGNTWHNYNTGLFYPLCYSLAISGEEQPLLITGSYGSGLYWTHPSTEPDIINDPGENFVPKTTGLGQNYPNPFNPFTTIEYYISETGPVKLSVHDILGREIRVLADETKTTGHWRATFDASDLSSGIYFYRLQTTDYSAVRKMALLR